MIKSKGTRMKALNEIREQDVLPVYVLITAARNEEAYIELTIKSMIRQTILPNKWVIVSDGSTDSTDTIVKKYTDEYKWIELVRISEREERNFAGKVYAFNAGHERVKELRYDIIGNLDADISFGQDFFEFLIRNFAMDSALGVAGTAFIEDSAIAYNYDIVSLEHVSGQCQMFRRECFKEIGGYLPIKGGGVDLVAVTTARMKGWKTRTFPGKQFIHHRRMGTGTSSLITSRFRFGKQDYYLGVHPLWEVCRSLYHMKEWPYILGGMFLFSGYIWGYTRRLSRPISREFIEFRRKEQMQRLRKIIFKTLRILD
jgi:poly-beta-1,6-N-acetyl-D-glucosamine synthase